MPPLRRLSWRGAAVAFMALMIAGCADRAEERLQAQFECDVLLAVTRQSLAETARWTPGRPMVFVIADDEALADPRQEAGLTDPRAGNGWWRDDGHGGGVPGPAPANALIRQMMHQSTAGYHACPAWFALVRAHHAATGEAAAKAVVDHARGGGFGANGYGATIVTLSRPAVDGFGEHALVSISNVDAPLAGGGRLIALDKRADGTWAEVSALGLWVS